MSRMDSLVDSLTRPSASYAQQKEALQQLQYLLWKNECTLRSGDEWKVGARILYYIAIFQERLGAAAGSRVTGNMSDALLVLQGLLFHHTPTKLLFSRPCFIEILVALLRLDTAPDELVISVVDTLLCVLVDSPENLHTFEQSTAIGDLVSILRLQKRSRSVQTKCLEFIFFYLLPERANLGGSGLHGLVGHSSSSKNRDARSDNVGNFTNAETFDSIEGQGRRRHHPNSDVVKSHSFTDRQLSQMDEYQGPSTHINTPRKNGQQTFEKMLDSWVPTTPRMDGNSDTDNQSPTKSKRVSKEREITTSPLTPTKRAYASERVSSPLPPRPVMKPPDEFSSPFRNGMNTIERKDSPSTSDTNTPESSRCMRSASRHLRGRSISRILSEEVRSPRSPSVPRRPIRKNSTVREDRKSDQHTASAQDTDFSPSKSRQPLSPTKQQVHQSRSNSVLGDVFGRDSVLTNSSTSSTSALRRSGSSTSSAKHHASLLSQVRRDDPIEENDTPKSYRRRNSEIRNSIPAVATPSRSSEVQQIPACEEPVLMRTTPAHGKRSEHGKKGKSVEHKKKVLSKYLGNVEGLFEKFRDLEIAEDASKT